VLSLMALGESGAGLDRDDPGLPAPVAGTIAVLQAVRDVEPAAPFWCATSGAAAVDRFEDVDPAAGSLWGLGTVAALDHPEAWGGLADLADPAEPRQLARLCAALAGLDGEDQLAVRPTGLLARRLTRAPLGQAPAARDWRPRGTVLVTGGTGAIGGQLARWLAGRGAGHLLLTGRRGLDAPGARDLAAELAELGAEATIAACDVADGAALARLLAAVPADRPVTAVLHAAGVLPDEDPLLETTLERFAEATRAKIAGAVHLDRLLAHQDLDAFVLFSSGAAV
jgi:hypothetical protein